MDSPALAEPRSPATRRKARVVALQVLYELDGARHDVGRVLDNRLRDDQVSGPPATFARKLVSGVIEHRTEIDNIMSRYAPAWPVEQMAMVDRNILRVAIYEITLGGETPPRVAINEAVELGKIFGSDSSPRFVNGVLGSLMQSGVPEARP